MDSSGWLPLRPDEDFVPQLLAASRARRGLDCAGAEIAAADVRAALLASGEADPFGLRVGNARITGPLDLRTCTVPVPVRFESCGFTDPVDVQGARIHELAITGDPAASRPAVLPGLVASGVRIDRNLILSGMVIDGDVATKDGSSRPACLWLTDADIGGSLVADGTRILPPTGRAVHADRMRVAGNIRLVEGFHATGELRMMAIRLGGLFDVMGARFAPADGRALDLAEATIGGSMFLLNSPNTGRRCRIGGRIEMSHATIRGALLIRNADLTAPPAGSGVHFYNVESDTERTFLLAPRLTVHGTLRVEGDTVIHGGILLPGAQLDGGMKLSGALWNPADTALDLNQAVLGGILDASDVSFEGTIRLGSAHINGPLRLENATFAKPRRRRCVSAVNVTVAGDVQLRGMAAVGGSLAFRGASVSGVFNAENAFVSNPGGPTVSLHMAQVTGNVRLCGAFRSVGRIVLTRAVIGGRLRADGATLTWKDTGEPSTRGTAVDADSAVIRGGVNLGWQVTAGAVDFTGASSSYLADRPAQDWPADSYIGGFAYERFEAFAWHGEAVWDPEARTAWLARMTRYDPRAWEHLAAVLRAAGDVDGAETVLVEQRRRARRLRTGRRRFYDVVQDVTVRYGFRPQRALYLLVALIAAVTVGLSLPGVQAQMRSTDQNALVFTPAGAQPLPDEHHPPGACGNGKVRCLSPFFYAVDTVVPLIDLHQRSAWYPVAERNGVLLEWLLNLCTILGWIASTVFALSFTRLGRAG
ncbi:hypothetical protein [Actinoplanes utahensis]|uniref:Oxidoreductase n=1 Tax=Actinoplanes utahensis TaxID=1869 RepID=A0A0A6UQY8_ACTUT|nr:hypothetical protein [Actinoplanes utahensis]KHD76789.1 hypothetical protein MB27_14625 [Actinoplanes utahensis]GIF33344.1 hypothetical protein Aut01nite_63300 [Actinoplanes utahensis]